MIETRDWIYKAIRCPISEGGQLHREIGQHKA